MPPKKGVRFSSTKKSSSSASKRRPDNIPTRTSPSRTRSGASFHNQAVDASSPGPGRASSRRPTISRSPNSPPTPHPRASGLPKTTKGKAPAPREVPYSADNDPERQKALAAQRDKLKNAATQTSSTHSPPQKVVKRQASARQKALDEFARRKYEPLVRRLWEENDDLLEQMCELQVMFTELVQEGRMTLFAVPMNKDPLLYHPQGDEETRSHARTGRRARTARAPVPQVQYQGFMCCKCDSLTALGERMVDELVCWTCGHRYGYPHEKDCTCWDVYS